MKKKLNLRDSESLGDVLCLRQQQCEQLHHQVELLSVILDEVYLEMDLPFTPEYRHDRIVRLIVSLLGSPQEDGWLQNWINQEMDNVLDRLQEDLPDLTREERLIFSYSAAGFSNNLSSRLAGLSSDNATSVLRTRLKKEIRRLRSENKEEYLSLLPTKSCRIG